MVVMMAEIKLDFERMEFPIDINIDTETFPLTYYSINAGAPEKSNVLSAFVWLLQ